MVMMRDILRAHSDAWLAAGGLLIGIALGHVAHRANFCTMGAVSDALYMGDWRRFRSWLLAISVAMAGAQALDAIGVVSLASSMYLAPRLNWLGTIFGGAIFGVGMVLAGGCGFRNLVRAGSGDIGSVAVLIALGIAAWAVAVGPLEPVRAVMEQATRITLVTPTQGLTDVIGLKAGRVSTAVKVGLSLVLCVGVLALSLRDRSHRRAWESAIAAGVAIGMLDVSGWVLTGLAYDPLVLAPKMPVSLTFVRPIADTLAWAPMRTGAFPGFGVATVIGAIVGAAVSAVRSERFHLQFFQSPGQGFQALIGGTLMGAGGIMALGCTIGQGISGVSTLATGSLIAFVAILAGAIAALKVIERMTVI